MLFPCQLQAAGCKLFVACLAGLFLTACPHYYYLDLPHIDLEPPDDLEERLLAYRAGDEPVHADPKAVADMTLRRELDLPWKADPFRPAAYEVHKTPEWGDFVIRGYRYPSGHVMRYRVKIKPYREIWYATQVSRFKIHSVPDEDESIHQHFR